MRDEEKNSLSLLPSRARRVSLPRPFSLVSVECTLFLSVSGERGERKRERRERESALFAGVEIEREQRAKSEATASLSVEGKKKTLSVPLRETLSLLSSSTERRPLSLTHDHSLDKKRKQRLRPRIYYRSRTQKKTLTSELRRGRDGNDHPTSPQSKLECRELGAALGRARLQPFAAPPLGHRVAQPPRWVLGEL